MNVITMPRKQYDTLVQRQERVEEELSLLREVVREQAKDDFIRPSVLKRWERISRDLDNGKGRVFESQAAVKALFKKL